MTKIQEIKKGIFDRDEGIFLGTLRVTVAGAADEEEDTQVLLVDLPFEKAFLKEDYWIDAQFFPQNMPQKAVEI